MRPEHSVLVGNFAFCLAFDFGAYGRLDGEAMGSWTAPGLSGPGQLVGDGKPGAVLQFGNPLIQPRK